MTRARAAAAAEAQSRAARRTVVSALWPRSSASPARAPKSQCEVLSHCGGRGRVVHHVDQALKIDATVRKGLSLNALHQGGTKGQTHEPHLHPQCCHGDLPLAALLLSRA
jgi:hypothetical protein